MATEEFRRDAHTITLHSQPVEVETTESSLSLSSVAVGEVARIYFQQAQAYCDAKQWEQALEVCQKMLAVVPTMAEAHKFTGKILQAQGRVTDAVDFYAKAIALQPNFPEVYSNLGSLYAREKKWAAAVAYYEKAIEQDPYLAIAYLNLAKVWKRLNRSDREMDCLAMAFRIQPDLGSAKAHYELAQGLSAANSREGAIFFYQQAVKKDPKMVSAYQALAKLLEECDDWQSAAVCYRKVMQLTADTEARDSAIFPASRPLFSPTDTAERSPTELFRRYAKAKDWPRAIEYVQVAITQSPQSAGLYRTLAKLYEQQEETESAARAWYRAFVLEPNWPDARECFTLGRMLEQCGETASAIRCYQKAMQLRPDFSAAYEALEKLLQSPVRIAEKNEPLTPLVDTKTKADDIKALDRRAHVAHQQGEAFREAENWQDAVVCYRKAARLKPDFSWSHHSIGDCCRALGDWEGAIAAYKEAIALNPDFVWSHYSMGEALEQLGRLANAVDAYTRASELASNSPQIELRLAAVLKRSATNDLQQYSERYLKLAQNDGLEEEVYRQAIALNPTGIDAYEKLARVLVNKGNVEEAIFVYQMALQVGGSNFDILMSLSKLLSETSQIDHAISCLSQSLKMEPDSFSACFRMGDLLCEKGELETAHQWFVRCLEIDERSHWTYQCIGNIHLWQGQFEEAISSYQKAVELEPTLSAAYKHMGDALTYLGQVDEASKAYGKAIELDPNLV